MSAGDPRPPEAFRPLEVAPERARGFRVGPDHLDPGGRCRGGVLASFSDMQLAFAAMPDVPGRGGASTGDRHPATA